MESAQSSVDSDDQFSLDCLPFDCIVLICEYLTASDLCRFASACKLFHEASLVGYIWRRHCLSRWTFCDILLIPEGPGRWRKYFFQRRKVDASLDTGRPVRDYKVKTLRGHEHNITMATTIGGSHVNWENPQPPLVVSLSSDGSVKAWDVLQAKPVWSLEGQLVTSIAANNTTLELATGKADGSIVLWDTQEWNVKMSLQSRLGGSVTALKYGSLKASKLPQTILLAHVNGAAPGQSDHLELWDPSIGQDEVQPDHQAGQASSSSSTTTTKQPLYELWSPSHNATKMTLSTSGLLAVPGNMGDVHIWQLPSLPSTKVPPPIPPHVTVNTSDAVSLLYWLSPSLLATTNGWMSVNIEVWDIGAHFEARRKAGRQMYDNINMYNPSHTLRCDVPLTALSVANDKIIAGDIDGNVRVLDPSKPDLGCLQKFSDHKGTVTDIYADRFRVVSCSKDFSIRVYRWKMDPKTQVNELESRYTLLGGSVAHKTHDGFEKLLCEATSCVGIAGNQLKSYIFSCKLPSQ